MKSIRKQDMVLACALVLIALLFWGRQHFSSTDHGAKAQISVDGQVIETLLLNKDQEFTVTGADGGSNHLIVQDGYIWCSEASCPDKVCIRQGKKNTEGDTIVCLPNKMIITIQ